MTELFNKDNEPVEAFTQEEVDQKLNEAKTVSETEKSEAIVQAKEEGKKEVEDLNTQIEANKKEIETLLASTDDDKTKNIVALRESNKELATKLEGVEQTTKEQLKGVLDRIDGEKVDNEIKKLIGDDEEANTSIKENIKNLGGIPEDPSKLSKIVEDAYTLHFGHRPSSPLNAGVIGTGGSAPTFSPKGGKLSEEGKRMANKLGVTPEEIKAAKLE